MPSPNRSLLRRLAARATTCLGAATLVIAPIAFASGGTAAAAAPFLRSANVPNYPGVLESSSGHTLYLLSTEKGGAFKCTKACLTVWHPVLVKSAVKRVSIASTVKGKIGFVKRSASQKQVTVNSYPVYTYSGDAGANQSHGEAVAADGGTWHLLHASAKTVAATPVAAILDSANIPDYPGVLENASGRTLYLLTTEKGGVVKCTGGCAAVWIPLTVTSSTTSVSLGSGVDGSIGFVARGSAKQVTFNSYPVYTYVGDAGANQSNGEGIAADGGTWYLLKASAKSPAATPVAAILDSASIPSYAGVLETASGHTLYVLSTEKGGVVSCTGGCASVWIPLTVSTASVSLGNGVDGTIGFVARGAVKQVTFNSYPVYTYTGDAGANQSNGEGLAADGGTWYLINASATTPAMTPLAAPPVPPTLYSASVPSFGNVLENASSHTLYLLTAESGGTIKCTGGCASVWVPLTVSSSTTSISLGSGVDGTIGFVTRGTDKQVTVNDYPVYTYTGDAGANQTNGEGIAADGGTWYLIDASATTPGATPDVATLESASITSHSDVLENASSHTLYLLTAESGGTIKCTGGCASVWVPLTVSSSTTSISLGSGVDGTIGFVTRGAAKQVTFNSYPVYTYTGDAGANESNGEGIVADGGTWYLIDASATTPGTTPESAPAGGRT